MFGAQTEAELGNTYRTLTKTERWVIFFSRPRYCLLPLPRTTSQKIEDMVDFLYFSGYGADQVRVVAGPGLSLRGRPFFYAL